MKFSLFCTLAFAAITAAQTQTPAPKAATVPGVNGPSVPITVLRPNDVVATVDGRKFTVEEMNALGESFAELKQNMKADPKTFLERYGVLISLTKEADKDGLEKTAPFKQRLEYSRMQILSQAAIDAKYAHLPVSKEEIQQYYNGNKDNFSSVKIRAIYLAFSPAPPPQKDPKAKKVLTEPATLELAKELVKKLRAGADFVAMVKEYSHDANSSSKDGEFGTFKKSSNIPAHIKTIIFALKKEEISEPVKQPNGYYIFRADEVTQQTLEQATGTVVSEVRDQKLQEWLQGLGSATKVSIENEAYFGLKPASPGAK